MCPVNALEPEDLYQPTDPEQLSFETTAELEDLMEVIGQPRAVEAARFGMSIRQKGYNLFALGPPGTGKRSLVLKFFEEQAAGEDVPEDWCYVNDFTQQYKPHSINLPAGKGVALQADMERLVEELETALSSAFESEEYQTRRQEIQESFQTRQEEKLEELRERARENDLALLRTPAGLVFAPLRGDEVVSPEEYQSMPEEERKAIEQKVEGLQEELQKTLNLMPRWQREMQQGIQALNREIAGHTIGGLFNDLRKAYEEYSKVVEYLSAAEEDVIENVTDLAPGTDFLHGEDGSGSQQALAIALSVDRSQQRRAALRRYRVNVLVDQSEVEHAPVIYEDNPTYQNLLGRIEYQPQMGALITDFNMIRPGTLHQANGGYLVLDARKVLLEPYAWEGLKRALEAGELRVESPLQSFTFISTVTLDPEPIPLNVKVALLGDATLYYLLSALDPEFSQLFKVMVDFDELMDRSQENQELYARLIATLAKKEGLRSFDRGAVARVIEQSARMVSDSEKLSARIRTVTDLLREADYWAGRNEHEVVAVGDVQQALDAQDYRSDRLRERVQEAILRETVFIDTEGVKEGQVNALSVMQFGNFAFARPSRITARVRLGRGEVVDIEREVEMSGPIHSKGVLILAGFLGARYASDRPLSLSASLVFEQSYGGVDGDSASSTELYALLSAISGVPIKQSLAVTGSVNQHGQVQAIGGVNEKIEGFFDVCKARGLTGEQGVLIPVANVKHLMLRSDVIEAVRAGEFKIYPIETIDQGVEVLTDVPAGEPDEEGVYPEGTLNALVQNRLQELAEARMQYAGGEDEKEKA